MFCGSSQERFARNALLDIEEASDDGNTDLERQLIPTSSKPSFKHAFTIAEGQQQQHQNRTIKLSSQQQAKLSKHYPKRSSFIDRDMLFLPIASPSGTSSSPPFDEQTPFQHQQSYQSQQQPPQQKPQQSQMSKRSHFIELLHPAQTPNALFPTKAPSPFDDIWNAPISTRAIVPSHSSKRVRSDEYTYLYHPLINSELNSSGAPSKPLTSHVTPAALSTRTNIVQTQQQFSLQQEQLPQTSLISSKQAHQQPFQLNRGGNGNVDQALNLSSINSNNISNNSNSLTTTFSIQSATESNGLSHTSRATPRRERIRPRQNMSPRSNISSSRAGKPLDDSPLTRQLSKLVRTSFEESVASAAAAAAAAANAIAFTNNSNTSFERVKGLPIYQNDPQQQSIRLNMLSEQLRKQQREKKQIQQFQQNSSNFQQQSLNLEKSILPAVTPSATRNSGDFKKLNKSSANHLRIEEEETLTREDERAAESQIDQSKRETNERFQQDGESIPKRLEDLKKDPTQLTNNNYNNMHQFLFQPRTKQSILHSSVPRKTPHVRYKTPNNTSQSPSSINTNQVSQPNSMNQNTDNSSDSSQVADKSIVPGVKQREKPAVSIGSASPKPNPNSSRNMNNFSPSNMGTAATFDTQYFLNVGAVLQRFRRPKQAPATEGTGGTGGAVPATTSSITANTIGTTNTTSTSESMNPSSLPLEESVEAIGKPIPGQSDNRLPQLNTPQFKPPSLSGAKPADYSLAKPPAAAGFAWHQSSSKQSQHQHQSAQIQQQQSQQSPQSQLNQSCLEGTGLTVRPLIGIPNSLIDLNIDPNFDLFASNLVKKRRSAAGTSSTRNGNACGGTRDLSPFQKYIDQKAQQLQMHQQHSSRLLDDRAERLAIKIKSSRSPSPIASAAIAMGIGLAAAPPEETRLSLPFPQGLITRFPQSQGNKYVQQSAQSRKQANQTQQQFSNQKQVSECFNDSILRTQLLNESPKKQSNDQNLILNKAAIAASNQYPITIKNIHNNNVNSNHLCTPRDPSPSKLPPISKELSVIL